MDNGARSASERLQYGALELPRNGEKTAPRVSPATRDWPGRAALAPAVAGVVQGL